MKIVLVVLFVGVIVALASAGMLMVRKRPPGAEGDAEADKRMARALAVRVALSVTLFLLILLGWKLGWIEPSGIPVGR